jgi:transglutaminase-like putative cysteine protease
MNYSVTHTTTYLYTDPVSLCHNLVHLRPRIAPRQTCHHSQLQVQPEPHGVQQQLDYFGNPIALFTIQEPHKELRISAKHRLEVSAGSATPDATPPWETVREALRTPRHLDAMAFTFDSQYIQANEALAAYAAPSFKPGCPIGAAALDLTGRIHREFRYDSKATTLATPLADVLAHRHGVCQDFAHLAIGCLRSLGLAARYVSGYVQTRAGPGRLVGADASHAWLAVYCGEAGWLDLDPTNNVVPGDQHLTIAWGRDYDDVSPIKGVILGGGTHTMTIGVEVVALP